MCKVFEMQHLFLNATKVQFNENTAPDWLTSIKTKKDSTIDMRWFWNKHILTLAINKSVETDFQKITRIK